jgi:hypothetical protein
MWQMRKWLAGLVSKNLLIAGMCLGVGALPCPDCGTPIIFHIWPIAGLMVIVQFIRKRNSNERTSEGSRNLPAPLGIPSNEGEH